MVRMILGVVAGFVGWFIAWIVGEKLIGAAWPAFAVHQAAFEEAIKNGGSFSADTGALITHVVLGTIVSLAAGAVAAVVAGKNSYGPFVVGCLLLAMGVAKAAMSWQYVPVWYHVVFTAMLLPLAVVGGRLISST